MLLLKRWVFNFLLKVSIEMDSLINLGTAFHNLGAANRKARSPRVALLSLELFKLYFDTGLGVIKKKNLSTKVLSP